MKARIDFHVHSEFSNDCNLKVEDILGKAKKENFFVAIADHNEIGGYLKSQKLKEKKRVIPAIECASKEGVHILFYFKKKENIVNFYQNVIEKNKTRDLFRMGISTLDLIKKAKKYDAIVGIPHPFMKIVGLMNSRKIKNPEKYLKLIDFYEIYNGAVSNYVNKKAISFYKSLKKPIIAGSDAHFLDNVGGSFTTVDDFNYSLEKLFKNLKKKTTFTGKAEFKIMQSVKKEIILILKSKKLDYLLCRLSRIIK